MHGFSFLEWDPELEKSFIACLVQNLGAREDGGGE